MKNRSPSMPFRSPEELTDFVVIDLETTGLSPELCEIIQVSAVRYVDHQEHSSFSSYVKPMGSIPPQVQALTGISDETVANAPDIEQILPEYLSFVLQSPFITGYNVRFDFSFLSEVIGVDLTEELTWFDTMTLARRAIPGLERYRLANVCAYIGFDTDFHDALNDCRACGAVLNYLCQENRMDHAIHSKAERFVALTDAMARDTMAMCQIDPDSIIPGGALCGKSVVFTGELSFSRATAKELAQQAGAVVKTCVSKKTDYLIVGVQDEVIVGCDGMSAKEEKAHSLIAAGYNIKILDETTFIQMMQGKEPKGNGTTVSV